VAPDRVVQPPPETGFWLQVVREAMTSLISLVILCVSTWMLVQTFRAAAGTQTETFSREKDVLLFALSLLGTVTGYYLGRVPAEQRAQQANQNAQQAQQQLAGAQSHLVQATAQAAVSQRESQEALVNQQRLKSQVRTTLESVQNALQTGISAPPVQAPRAEGAGEAPPAAPPTDATDRLRQAQLEVEFLLRQLE
jgi:hypothetical protein